MPSGIGKRGYFEPGDIDIYRGEVVGSAGLLGSGRTELVRLAFDGADKADSGAVEVAGKPQDHLTAARNRKPRRVRPKTEGKRAWWAT